MKTPFQKMLLSKIQEQAGVDINRQHSLDFPDFTKPDGEMGISNQDTAYESSDDDDFNFGGPDGAVLQDENGNGIWDEGEQWLLNGILYDMHTILVHNPNYNPNEPDGPENSEFLELTTLTYNYQGQMIAWTNGQWQAVLYNSDGIPVMMENVWVWEGGWYVTFAHGMYFMTQDNPMEPGCTWWNPQTGNIPGTYAQWGLSLGWSSGEWSGNIPLVPFGDLESNWGDWFPQWNPNMNHETMIQLLYKIRFSGPDMSAEMNRHRMAWTAFWEWYINTFNAHPPEYTWPTNADWWDNWNGTVSGPLGGGTPRTERKIRSL